MKTDTELGQTFTESQLGDFVVLLQKGLKPREAKDRLNLSEALFRAILNAWLGEVEYA